MSGSNCFDSTDSINDGESRLETLWVVLVNGRGAGVYCIDRSIDFASTLLRLMQVTKVCILDFSGLL